MYLACRVCVCGGGFKSIENYLLLVHGMQCRLCSTVRHVLGMDSVKNVIHEAQGTSIFSRESQDSPADIKRQTLVFGFDLSLVHVSTSTFPSGA